MSSSSGGGFEGFSGLVHLGVLRHDNSSLIVLCHVDIGGRHILLTILDWEEFRWFDSQLLSDIIEGTHTVICHLFAEFTILLI